MSYLGNPQGKGLAPMLDAWRDTRPARVSAKPPQTLLRDYLTTLLVLSADFQFRPVPGQDYFLYFRDPRWQLSLIAPWQWRRQPGLAVGCCQLQTDMTWSLAPHPDLDDHPELLAALEAFQQGFVTMLADAEVLEDTLPDYLDSLPYYRRLLASGMATSMRESMTLGQQRDLPSKQWLAGMSHAMLANDSAAQPPDTAGGE